MQGLELKAAATDRTRISLKARASTPVWPVPMSASEFFDLDTELIVQLLNSETPTCWSTSFSADDTVKNDGGQFRAIAR